MTEKAKEAVLPHPGDDGYSRLEHHVLSNIWSDKCVAVNRYSVKKSIDGVIKKFIVHSRSEDADRLRALVDNFLESKAFDDSQQRFWTEGFIVQPYEDMLLDEEGILGKGSGSLFPLGLLHLIRDKVLHLGKNMELLQRLDHLSEVPKVSPKFEGTLHEALKRNLESYLQQFVAEEDENETADSDELDTSDYESLAGDSLHQTFTQQLHSFQDYHLVKYYIQWYLLSLLLHLANNPTSAHNTEPEPIQLDNVEEKEEIDWPAYLLEGQPKYQYYNSGSETEDDWNSSDELQEEYSMQSEDPLEHEKEVSHVQVLESSQADAKENPLNKAILWHHVEERASEAEKWLKDHVQNPSHEGYKACSKFSSANLAEFLDSKRGGRTDNALPTSLMSEYRVLRETLWALQVPPSLPAYLLDDWKGLFLPDESGNYAPQKAVTIPSLSKGSFYSQLKHFGHYISYVREIENSISEIFSPREILVTQDAEEELPPYTYEAYASALKEFLDHFKERVLAIEEKVKSQEGVNTLLTVSKDLEPLLNELRLVHGIHQKSMCDWKENSNWYCACRLLTMLYGLLSSPLSDVNASICFKLFIKTFKPYLDIIHIWLTEGRLEDWRKEFIITKNVASFGNTERFWTEGFIVQPYEDMLLDEEGILGKGSGSLFPLGLLHLIRDKVLHLGKNMELLQRLDHLSEVPKVSPKFEGTLHEALKRNLESYLQQFVAEEDENETADSDELDTSDYESLAGDSLHQTFTQQLHSFQDYHLVKVFEGFLKKEDFQNPSESKKLKKKNDSIVVPMVLPMKPIIEKHFSKLLEERHIIAGNIVSTVLLGEYALKFHLLNVRKIFLMEAGDLLHHFCSHVFQQAEKGEKWTDSFTLTTYLQECIAVRYPEAASLFSISISEKSDKPSHLANVQAVSHVSSGESVFDQVDLITLNYSVEWPVNIVLNSASMESYNTVFQFLLKVRWALWSLQQLRFSDLTGSKTALVPKDREASQESDIMTLGAKIHRMQLLRAWLLHFVGSIHAYLMGRVLHGLGIKLEADLEAASDLDTIIH
ncbi:hypothetical protein J437_LFUL012510, partial [Ladona fulva]